MSIHEKINAKGNARMLYPIRKKRLVELLIAKGYPFINRFNPSILLPKQLL